MNAPGRRRLSPVQRGGVSPIVVLLAAAVFALLIAVDAMRAAVRSAARPIGRQGAGGSAGAQFQGGAERRTDRAAEPHAFAPLPVHKTTPAVAAAGVGYSGNPPRKEITMHMVQQPAARAPLGTVSHTLWLTIKARRAAARCGKPVDMLVRSTVDTYRSTGSRFDAMRALNDAMHDDGATPGGAA